MTGKRALYRRKPCTITPCSVLYLVGIYKLKEIIKNIDDNERVLLTMPELKYVHNVKEIEINPLNTENEVIDGVVLIGCKHC